MSPSARKLILALHLTASIGWIGAVAAYLRLDITAVTSEDANALRSAYLGMDAIAGNVIVPLAITALLTGIAISLGTKWGLFKHYWTAISLIMTTIAVIVLIAETRTIDRYAAVAASPSASVEELQRLGGTLPHSLGGMVVLLVVLVLNVYKPQGLTRHGQRRLSR